MMWRLVALTFAIGCRGDAVEPPADGPDPAQTDLSDTSPTVVSGGSGTTIPTESSSTSLVLHPSCSEALDPSHLPDPPPSNLAGSDRPAFDLWRDIDCGTALATVPTCDEEAPCGGPLCLQGTEGGIGVCALYNDVDIWCDGEGQAMGYLDDQCWVCVPNAVHAAACCLDPDAFDCRVWPYPSDGPPWSVCKEHSDCEPGLLCGTHRGSGYGICRCPGLDPDSIMEPDICWESARWR